MLKFKPCAFGRFFFDAFRAKIGIFGQMLSTQRCVGAFGMAVAQARFAFVPRLDRIFRLRLEAMPAGVGPAKGFRGRGKGCFPFLAWAQQNLHGVGLQWNVLAQFHGFFPQSGVTFYVVELRFFKNKREFVGVPLQKHLATFPDDLHFVFLF